MLKQRERKRGAVLVEFALIMPLLVFLLLGIMEFGVLVMHQMTLVQAAREGSRLAAVRRPVADITQRIKNSAATLPNPDELTISLAYSTTGGDAYPFTLGDASEVANDAPPGSLVQVRLDCPHHLITGNFFSWLAGSQNGTVPMRARVVMRRE